MLFTAIKKSLQYHGHRLWYPCSGGRGPMKAFAVHSCNNTTKLLKQPLLAPVTSKSSSSLSSSSHSSSCPQIISAPSYRNSNFYGCTCCVCRPHLAVQAFLADVVKHRAEKEKRKLKDEAEQIRLEEEQKMKQREQSNNFPLLLSSIQQVKNVHDKRLLNDEICTFVKERDAIKAIRSKYIKQIPEKYEERNELNGYDRVALRDYTSDGFQSINKALRDGTSHKSPVMQTRISRVKRAMYKRATGKGGSVKCIVYRGMESLPPAIMKSLRPGATYSDNSFMSTSWDMKRAMNFAPEFKGGVLFEIMCKTGVNVAPLSKFKFEKEILFYPNTMFKVHDMFEIISTGMILIQLEEMV